VKLGNVAPRPLVVVQESKETNLICNVVVVDASSSNAPKSRDARPLRNFDTNKDFLNVRIIRLASIKGAEVLTL